MNELIDRVKTFYAELPSDPVATCDKYLAADFVLENFLPEQILSAGATKAPTAF